MIKFFKINNAYWLALACGMMFLSSCNSNRYLSSGQTLLKKTKIVFKNNLPAKEKNLLQVELTTFITPKPNDKVLFFIPKEYLYLSNDQPGRDIWYHRAIKSLGEPPVLYSEPEAKTNALNMENYLRFKKGYYDAKVDFITDEAIRGWSSNAGNEVWFNSEVTYIVSTGERFKIKSIQYEAQDKVLLTFVESIKSDSYINSGDYVDFSMFEREKSRLTIELQNNGYINFSNNYIEISGDSSQVNKNIDIFMQIRSPLPDTTHARFTTGKVTVYTDYYKDQPFDSLVIQNNDSIKFLRQSKDFLVKTSLLSNSIFFKERKLLSKDDKQKTFRKLNGLGTYRFVTITGQPDADRDSVMNFDILLTPFEQKWIFDGGLQGYFSTLGSARLFGLSLSSQFVNRNLLGGSEKYSLRAEIGSELGYSRENGIVRRTSNLTLQNNLNIPSFRDFVGLGRLAYRTGLIKDKFYKNFVEESSTNIGLGYSLNNIIDRYSLSSFNANFGFDYTSPKNNRYVFRPLGFNLDLYAIQDTALFESNPLILKSFKDILGTGFIFRDFTYIFNKNKNSKGNSFLVINNFEMSGWEVHLSNLLYNAISESDKVWSLNNQRQIAFAKYARYEFDGRYNKEFSKTTSFATRVNLGIIVPFGKNPTAPYDENTVAPFIKQFGVGGPNSLRAWNIKEPGPGGYRNPLDKITQTPSIFVNQGDIKIELNAEYRFKMLLILDGALFVDAGNVWTLRTDPNRPDSEISSKFLDQMAVGIGYGLRFNFDFFIIRFDFGYKVRSPFQESSKTNQWYTFKEIREQGIGNIQVGVNYPF